MLLGSLIYKTAYFFINSLSVLYVKVTIAVKQL